MVNVRSVTALLFLTVTLSACGGGGGSSAPTAVATPTPAPTPPPPQVLGQGAGRLPAQAVALVDVSVPANGTLEAVVDWTFARNDVDVAVIRGACTPAQFNAGQCTFLGATSSTTAKPERITVGVTTGPHTIAIANFSTEDESASYQVIFRQTVALNHEAASARAVPARFQVLRSQRGF